MREPALLKGNCCERLVDPWSLAPFYRVTIEQLSPVDRERGCKLRVQTLFTGPISICRNGRRCGLKILSPSSYLLLPDDTKSRS